MQITLNEHKLFVIQWRLFNDIFDINNLRVNNTSELGMSFIWKPFRKTQYAAVCRSRLATGLQFAQRRQPSFYLRLEKYENTTENRAKSF